MTKKELEHMAQKSLTENEITHWSTGTSGFHKGFEACYRLLTTPRPMSEAPRDRTVILGIPNVVITWNPAQKRWFSNGLLYTDDDFTGWLPIFTPIEEDTNG